MKKILITLFTLLMLVGCSSKGYSSISNGDDVIFKGPDSTYTKADLYKQLKVSSEESIENDILNKIANKMEINLEDVEKEADDLIEMYKSMGYDQAIIAYYGSYDAFKSYVMSSGVITELAKSYIADNYETLIANDKPVKMQMVKFAEKETAENFIKDVKENGKTFETAAIDNGYDMECPASVYLDTDDISLNVKSYLNETADTGLSSLIVESSSNTDADGNINTTDTYYVLNIISRNVDEFKDDYEALKLESLDNGAVKEYAFSNHDIKFYDQDIYEIMKAQYEVLQ